MLGNSLLGNRQLGDSEIGVRAPIYFTVNETITKTEVSFSISSILLAFETIAKSELWNIASVLFAMDSLKRRERVSALMNGSPVSLVWRKFAKIITTLWTKTPKP